MSDPLIRALDNYVILEPGKEERFLSKKETLSWLVRWLESMEKLPQDLKEKASMQASANHLLDTACDLEVKPGFRLQWFAVRLDEPNDQ